MNRSRRLFLLPLAAAAAVIIGCYRGEFLAGQMCEQDSDCGPVLSCNQGICGEGPPESPVLEVSLSPVKQFDFSWAPTAGVDYYQLLESADVGEPHVEVGEQVMGQATSLTVPLHLRANASYALLGCNEFGCSESETVGVVGSLAEAVGYFKASNIGMFLEDGFGGNVALSEDGSTLAVSTVSLTSNNASIYVFAWDGQTWAEQANVQTTVSASIGVGSVALSGDGDTLAVGFATEGVQILGRNGQTWTERAYLESDTAGNVVALSADGNTLAVGDTYDNSSAAGINGDEANGAAPGAGAAYVFVRHEDNWTQEAYVKASNPDAGDEFGFSLGLSGDGNTLAVAAIGEVGNATASK